MTMPILKAKAPHLMHANICFMQSIIHENFVEVMIRQHFCTIYLMVNANIYSVGEWLGYTQATDEGEKYLGL